VLQAGPELPAETSTKIPAAWVFSTMVRNVSAAHISLVGQPQLLFMTSGRRSGFGFWLFRSVGAMNHWKHSVYVSGRPTPWSMLWQPIHLAPGATPIWLPEPSSPEVVPVVCVPWASSSHGSGES
jgi:hypothetical protein